MRRVKISDLKAHLSEYLREVQRGETIVVCDRDRAIARLEPEGDRKGLLRIHPATRPTSDLSKIRPLRPRGHIDIMELLDREDRV